MAIESIDRELCVGACSICVNACPVDVLRLDAEGKACIAYPDDCYSCLWCAMDCPSKAIRVSRQDSWPWLTSFYP